MANRNDIVKAESQLLQPREKIENLIHVIRDQQVMLDRDLASLYGVETKRLNQQVQRNLDRFPEDFMFQLSKEEFENLKSQIAVSSDDKYLRSQFATSNDFSTSRFAILNEDSEDLRSQNATSNKRGGQRYLPYVFSENGVAMLSSVLRSPQAISMNIQIMRAFTAMRRFIAANAQVFQRLEVIEHTQLSLAAHQESTDQKVEEIFRRLEKGSVTQKQGIFYDGQIFDAYSFISDLIRDAKKRIVLIDNYVDDSVLKMLDKRATGVSAKIFTKHWTPQLSIDIKKHNAQYAPIEVEQFDRAHDRFLCIDDTVYLIGASIKDLGKKWFGFTKMEQTTDELLSKI